MVELRLNLLWQRCHTLHDWLVSSFGIVFAALAFCFESPSSSGSLAGLSICWFGSGFAADDDDDECMLRTSTFIVFSKNIFLYAFFVWPACSCTTTIFSHVHKFD